MELKVEKVMESDTFLRTGPGLGHNNFINIYFRSIESLYNRIVNAPFSRDQPFLRICGLKEELKSSAELWLSKHSWQMRHLANFSNKLRSVKGGAGLDWTQVKILSGEMDSLTTS